MPAHRATEHSWRPLLIPPPLRGGDGAGRPGLGSLSSSALRAAFALDPVEPLPSWVAEAVQRYDSRPGIRPSTRRGRAQAPKDERPVVTDDECALQMELVFTDGGEYSANYSCDNLLRNDGSCYSSLKRDCINVVARVKGEPHFSMTDIEAVAPVEGYTSPLGQGCVFVSWDAPNLAMVKQFDDVCSREEFDRRSRQQAGASPALPSTPVPVGFFEIPREMCRVSQHLPVPRSGRYVLIKLLRSQTTPSENVDVEYIGFRGLTCPHGFEGGSLL